MAQKERLDILLVQKNITESREKAKALIMTGNVFVNNQREDKPGTKVDIKSDIVVKGNPLPYVSRGGLKLEKAIKVYGLKFDGLVCLDIGASTGGFTDCMLQNGAEKVYSIDVGYGQLAWSLRQNPKVVCMEKTNVRYVVPDDIGEKADFASFDVSFISLKKVINPVLNLLTDEGEIVCLIKPQFEAGREKVGKKGVVRDKKVHQEVIVSVTDYFVEQGLKIRGINYSPIKGPEGNIEYLVYMGKQGEHMPDEQRYDVIKQLVDNANESL